MNGAEALKKIRKLDNAQETPVIILTNLGEEEAPKDLASLNISSYIVKANLTPSRIIKKSQRNSWRLKKYLAANFCVTRKASRLNNIVK